MKSARIQELYEEAEKLPILTDTSLWAPDNHRNSIMRFFKRILDCKHPEIAKRVNASDLSGSAEEVWRRLDEAKHPVRNGLILEINNLL